MWGRLKGLRCTRSCLKLDRVAMDYLPLNCAPPAQNSRTSSGNQRRTSRIQFNVPHPPERLLKLLASGSDSDRNNLLPIKVGTELKFITSLIRYDPLSSFWVLKVAVEMSVSESPYFDTSTFPTNLAR